MKDDRPHETLTEFFNEEDQYKAGMHLEWIICSIAEPVATRYIEQRFRLRITPDPDTSREQDALELVSEVKVALIDVLMRLKSSRDRQAPVFESIEAYTATVARNAFNEYFRRRYPARFRLSNQLRYLLTKDPRLRIVQDGAGNWVCGTSETIEFARDRSETADVLAALLDLFARLPAFDESLILRDRIFTVLNEIGRAVSFEHLVAATYESCGIREPRDVPVEEVQAPARNQEMAFRDSDRRSLLAAVWNELPTLTVRHRRALLLHLSDDLGDNLLLMFPMDGIASIRMIADLVEMPAAELAAIWNRLPLPDNEIADIMGLERQQVINLRQSARRALRKRLSNLGFFSRL